MKKTLKGQVILDTAKIFTKTKLTKLEDGELFQVIKTMRTVKDAAKPIQDVIDTATKALEPENYKELLQKADNFTMLSEAEQIEVNAKMQAFLNRRARATSEELMKDVKLDITPISENTMDRIIKSNDFTVAEILTLQDVLCK